MKKLLILDPDREYRTDEECWEDFKAYYYIEDQTRWLTDPAGFKTPLMGRKFVPGFYENINSCLSSLSHQTKVLFLFDDEGDECKEGVTSLCTDDLFAKIPKADLIGHAIPPDEGWEGFFCINKKNVKNSEKLLEEIKNASKQLTEVLPLDKEHPYKKEVQSNFSRLSKFFRICTGEDSRGQEIEDKYEKTYRFPGLGLIWYGMDYFNVAKSEVLLITDRPELLKKAKTEKIDTMTFETWFASAKRVKKFAVKSTPVAAKAIATSQKWQNLIKKQKSASK